MPESKMMRVFGLRTYCDLSSQRHAMHTMYSLPRKEVMGKHKTLKKNLIVAGIVMREEDYDADTDPKILNDEDSVDDID